MTGTAELDRYCGIRDSPYRPTSGGVVPHLSNRSNWRFVSRPRVLGSYIPKFDPRLEPAFERMQCSPHHLTWELRSQALNFQQRIFLSIRLFDPLRSILSSRPGGRQPVGFPGPLNMELQTDIVGAQPFKVIKLRGC
jgi:hypothetical protein